MIKSDGGSSAKRLPEESEAHLDHRPLAERLRPTQWDEFVGLEAINKSLATQLREGQGRPPSLILWGPPGSGKTTLARLIGGSFDCHFVQFSAVLGGVKEVREIVTAARQRSLFTLLFVDEIHRFNKAQQDAFLPHIEDGTIVLVGATTENPSFALTGALLSRATVVVLPAVERDDLLSIVKRACSFLGVQCSSEASALLSRYAQGDARTLLNLVESFLETTGADRIEEHEVREFLRDAGRVVYDRDGEQHYNVASAFIKSMRGSDVDAALYWGFRMLEGGEDPRFLLRRLIIFASEDIGNADPRALQLAVAASDAYEKLGLPEGRIPIAHAITYLAAAPKSNRSYSAMHRAVDAVRAHPHAEVPLHLRNAPTGLMKELGYGKQYRYPHDEPLGYAEGVQYLPAECRGSVFYEPSERGYEGKLREHLKRLALHSSLNGGSTGGECEG